MCLTSFVNLGGIQVEALEKLRHAEVTLRPQLKSKPPEMAAQLSSLLSKASLDSDEEILKAANEALKRNKTDQQAQHARAVALLKLDRYGDALKAFEAGGSSLQQAAQLEHAYALYKCDRLEDAAKVAGSDGSDPSLRHIEAQSTYKLEEFGRAQEVYDGLAKPGSQDSESDLRINQGATDAQLSWSGNDHLARKIKSDKADLDQFETAFNAACGSIARGELKQASILLTRAKDLCNSSDYLSDEEKQAEVLPITVQQIYVHAQLSEVEKAQQLCTSVKPFDISDNATRHIAQANVLFVNSSTPNPFLSHRTFHETSRIPAVDRPFAFQSSILHRDALALDLQVGKGPSHGATDSASSRDASTGVFTAASVARSQTGQVAIKEILPLLEKNPNDLGLLLTVIHLYLLTNNSQTAAALLNRYLTRLEQSGSAKDQETRFAPGLVALQLALNRSLQRTTRTKAELAKAATFWRHRSKDSQRLAPLFSTAALELLDAPTAEEAKEARSMFESLNKQNPTNKTAHAGLCATASDATSNQESQTHLPSIADLITGIDVAALSAAGIARPPSHPQSQSVSQPTKPAKRPADDTPKPSKPKKVRLSRQPKDFDPNKKVDPERWLPLRDRSNYRPKGKKKGKGKGAAGGGMMTQGGIEEDSRPGTPGQGQGQSQTVQGKVGGPGKKGKKGKR